MDTMRKVLIYLTAAMMSFALSGCGAVKIADKYEDSLTKAYIEKLDGEKLTVNLTVTIDYDKEKIGDDSYSQLLEVNGENRHLFESLESGDIEFYQTDGKTWRVDAKKKEIHPLDGNGNFGADNADTVLKEAPESDDFVSAEKDTDGNIRETFDIDGTVKVFTYDGKTGELIDMEYKTDSIPGDNSAVIKLTVNSFKEDCGEIKLPEGYTMID